MLDKERNLKVLLY